MLKCFVCGNVDLYFQCGEVHCTACEPTIFDDLSDVPTEATETVEMANQLAAA